MPTVREYLEGSDPPTPAPSWLDEWREEWGQLARFPRQHFRQEGESVIVIFALAVPRFIVLVLFLPLFLVFAVLDGPTIGAQRASGHASRYEASDNVAAMAWRAIQIFWVLVAIAIALAALYGVVAALDAVI